MIQRFITRIVDFFYITPINRLMPLQTFRYLVCGGANMALDLLLYFVFYHFVFDKQIIHLPCVAISPYIAAFIFVFPITFLTGFWLNKNIAFRYSPLRGHVQLLRYLLSVGGSILLNYLLMKLFVEVFGFYPTPSKALTTLVCIVYSYLMQKYFTFRGCRDEADECKY